MLKDKCVERNCQFNDDDKKFFFGAYDSSPEKFSFMPGEKVLMMNITNYVKSVVDANGLNSDFSTFNIQNNTKLSRKDTCQFFGCTFFGKKTLPRIQHTDFFTESETCKPVSQNLKHQLMPKLKAQFEIKDPNLKHENYLSEDMIELNYNGSRIVALVACVFCVKEKKEKKITVQFDTAKNGAAYWNFSNLKKHFKFHSIKNSQSVNEQEGVSYHSFIPNLKIEPDFQGFEVKEEDEESELSIDVETIEIEDVGRLKTFEHIHIIKDSQSTNEQEDVTYHSFIYDLKVEPVSQNVEVSKKDEEEEELNVSIDDIEIMEILDDSSLNTSGASAEDIETYEIENFVDTNSNQYQIFQQITEQNLFMTKTIFTHSETQSSMEFDLNGKLVKIPLVPILGDGNCMFGTLSHQLFGHKVDSAEHQQSAAELRMSAVQYIEANFEDFINSLKGRVMDEIEERNKNKRSKKPPVDVTEKKCKNFLKTLKQNGVFGGSESLTAIRQTYSVNILIFNESGPCYFPYGFNPNYKRTIFMAYRLVAGSQTDRNHYESPTDVNMKHLFDCVKMLCGAETKKDGSEVHIVNDTIE